MRYALLTRLMSLWIRPTVLPTNPASAIDPDSPVLYMLEVGGLADRAALDIVTRQYELLPPGDPLHYAGLRESSSVDVLLRKPDRLLRRSAPVISRRLSRLVRQALEHDAPELQIVPVAVYWGRAPDKQASLWKLWFSENWQIAGRTRKFLTTLMHGRQHTLVSFSEPLSLHTLIDSDTDADSRPELLTRKLARILRVHFRQRRIATLGPDQSHRRMLVDHVLSDPSVRHAIRQDSRDSDTTRATRKARRYANEIAADVSYPTVRVLHRLLTRLWTELYDGVEVDGIERLRRVSDGRELVYVPCHRSHIDYLLLSYLLYEHGFSLPHIAAGLNLNLPVVGGLLRRGGAFFLRRSFTGMPLYSAVFNAYLKELLQRGYALEYFVEGGRSRTGRLLPPKAGMLAMTVHAYLSKPETPVVFIPVYFGYEKLLEGKAFISELSGAKKKGESILGIFRSLKTLRGDYGRVYVNFGEPIELDPMLDSANGQWRTQPVEHGRPAWIKPVIEELGDRIMRNINAATSVTPMSLLATAMLSTPRGCIDELALQQQLSIYQRLLETTYQGTQIVVPKLDIRQLIEHGCQLGFIERERDDLGPIIQLRPGQAMPLTYFKNNILHLLSLPALIAASFNGQSSQSEHDLSELISLSLPFIQGELFAETSLSPEELSQALEALREAGLLHQRNRQWQRASGGTPESVLLQGLAQVVIPTLERDFLCACLLVQAGEKTITREALATACQRSARRLSVTQGRDANELFDKHLHKAFVDSLIEYGYLTSQGESLRADESLSSMEKTARAYLSESSRHAIMAVSKAAVPS